MADLGENSCITQDPECVESAKMEGEISTTEGQSSSHNIVDRDFTTEIFKIEIGNLPKCYSVSVSIILTSHLEIREKTDRSNRKKLIGHPVFNNNLQQQFPSFDFKQYHTQSCTQAGSHLVGQTLTGQIWIPVSHMCPAHTL